jgi:hypothetical protein
MDNFTLTLGAATLLLALGLGSLADDSLLWARYRKKVTSSGLTALWVIGIFFGMYQFWWGARLYSELGKDFHVGMAFCQILVSVGFYLLAKHILPDFNSMGIKTDLESNESKNKYNLNMYYFANIRMIALLTIGVTSLGFMTDLLARQSKNLPIDFPNFATINGFRLAFVVFSLVLCFLTIGTKEKQEISLLRRILHWVINILFLISFFVFSYIV